LVGQVRSRRRAATVPRIARCPRAAEYLPADLADPAAPRPLLVVARARWFRVVDRHPPSYLESLGMKRDATRGNLDVLLLRILSAGPLHGYAVITALKERSGGLFDLPEGTVYPSLHRLEAAGLVASAWEFGGVRRRRVYQLTSAGEASLAQGQRDWQRFAAGIRAVLEAGT